MIVSIGESRPKEFRLFGRLTEFIEGVGHSHVFISWKDSDGRRWVAESRGGGIRMVSNRTFKKDSEVINIYQFKCDSEDHLRHSVDYVWEFSGSKYGFLSIFGLLLMRIANYAARLVTGRNQFRNPFRDGEGSQICCEFAMNVALRTSNRINPPRDLESWGLRETQVFNMNNGERASREKIDRINRRK